MPRKTKKIPNDLNPGIVAGTPKSDAAMEGSVQEPVGGQRKDKGKGNVRVPPQNVGVTWLDFAKPYLQRKKKGGMKQAGLDWKKLKSKKNNKKKVRKTKK